MEIFEKINWGTELSIGNLSIDNDHRKLIEIYNHLVELTKSKGRRDEFAEILTDLTEYSLYHFQREEDYMNKMSYPKLDQHISYHRDYIYKVAMFNYKLMGVDPPKLEVIIIFLSKWLEQHILISDKDYETYKNIIDTDATY